MSLRSLHKSAVGLALLLCCAACSSTTIGSAQSVGEAKTLIAQPITKPAYLGILQPSPGFTGAFTKPVCFTVIDEGLWEPGNEADALSAYLVTHIQFVVDGQQITAKPLGGLVDDMLGYKYDAQGKYLGSYGGSIETCYQLNLAKGLHIAEVEVSSMSGKQYAYKWAFELQ